MERTSGKRLFTAWLVTLVLALGCPAAGEEGVAAPPAVIRPGGIGTIQRIHGEVVVIDDRCYAVSPSTEYRAADGASVWKESFSAGDRVTFETGAGGDILLLRMLR